MAQEEDSIFSIIDCVLSPCTPLGTGHLQNTFISKTIAACTRYTTALVTTVAIRISHMCLCRTLLLQRHCAYIVFEAHNKTINNADRRQRTVQRTIRTLKP